MTLRSKNVSMGLLGIFGIYHFSVWFRRCHGLDLSVSVLALSGASRQLPQRGSHWRAGPLCTGRPRPDRAQKSGPRLRGQRLLDKSTLSSCCGARPQGTTVLGQRKLCSSRVSLTGTPVPLPLGEVAAKQTERARMLPEKHWHSDSIALTKSLLIAAQRL